MADPITIAAATAAGASGLQAVTSLQSGRTAKTQADIAAEQEEIAATSREADRKSRLADALASQNAAAGARNVAAFEGSPLSVLQEDIRAEERATERDIAQTRLRAMTLRFRGEEAKRQGQVGALTGLLRAGASAAGAGAGATAATATPTGIGSNIGFGQTTGSF